MEYEMTMYLETKTNSIEEAISSVVKGEGFASDAQRRAAFAQGYKAKGKKDKKEELDEIFKDMKNPAVAKKLLKKYEKQLAGATTTQGKEKIKEIIKQLKQAMMK